jgi:hypothetical protein
VGENRDSICAVWDAMELSSRADSGAEGLDFPRSRWWTWSQFEKRDWSPRRRINKAFEVEGVLRVEEWVADDLRTASWFGLLLGRKWSDEGLWWNLRKLERCEGGRRVFRVYW